MRTAFQSQLLLVTLMRCWCIGPDWNNHPIMQQTSDEKIESYTVAHLNVTYVDRVTGEFRIDRDKRDSARFGEYHVAPVAGLLIHVRSEAGDEPYAACGLPLRPSHGQFPVHERWVALVKRGKCNFQQKVENAFHSNASGIIIYNDKDMQSVEKMKLQRNVPPEFGAVATNKKRGEELSKLVDNGTRVTVQITVGDTLPKYASNINKTSVLFVSVSFIVLMVVSLGWIIFYYVQKCRYIHAKERLSKRLCSAAKKALQKIPTRYIRSDEKDGSNLGETDCCAICIELFKPADVVRSLPCRHEFHKLCIDPWLLENRTCPMCKMDILKHFGFELTGSQESMLRVEQEDPFTDIFFYDPDTPPSPSTVLPVTVVSHAMLENRPTTSSDCIGTVSRAIIDADAERNTISIFGKSQKPFNKNNETRSSIKRSRSLENVPSTSHS